MVRPRNRPPNIAAIQIMVVAAFFEAGSRKAGTPFEIASMPVKAVQPEENARRSRNSVSPSTAGTGGGGGASPAPKSNPPRPGAITNPKLPTNREVGTPQNFPRSPPPPRMPPAKTTSPQR